EARSGVERPVGHAKGPLRTGSRGVPRDRPGLTREVAPNQPRWERERIVDRQAWLAAGKQSIVGLLIPERFGGAGTSDFRYRCVVMEELGHACATSLSS